MENIKSYIVELVKKVEGRKPDAKGGNKQCYFIDGYALLKDPSIDDEELKQVAKIQIELKEKGVNICTTLGLVTLKEDKDKEFKRGYVLQERAKGKPIHKSESRIWSKTKEEIEEIRNQYMEELEQLKMEEQTFYDKFVSDWIEIKKSGLKIDPSKTGNFYYEVGKAISFIDLNLGAKKDENINMRIVCNEIAVVLADGIKYNNCQIVPENQVKKRINLALTQIFKKMSNSLEKQGMSKEEIIDVIKNRFPEIDIDKKDCSERAQTQIKKEQINKEERD